MRFLCRWDLRSGGGDGALLDDDELEVDDVLEAGDELEVDVELLLDDELRDVDEPELSVGRLLRHRTHV